MPPKNPIDLIRPTLSDAIVDQAPATVSYFIPVNNQKTYAFIIIFVK